MKYKIKLSPYPQFAGRAAYERPEITLLVCTSFGNTTLRFSVDTGADITAIPMWLARAEGIDISLHAVQGTVTGIHEQTVAKLRDWITFQIATVRYHWPCDFLLLPQTASAAARLARLSDRGRTCVLGRAGFLREFTVCIDDKSLKITCRNRSCPWWRRWWYKLRYGLFPVSWDSDQPLGEPEP